MVGGRTHGVSEPAQGHSGRAGRRALARRRPSDALGIGYVQFTRYVRHYLRRGSDARPKPAPVRTMPIGEAAPRQGFQFDPTAVDRKKLI
jgi:hypothetical protein